MYTLLIFLCSSQRRHSRRESQSPSSSTSNAPPREVQPENDEAEAISRNGNGEALDLDAMDVSSRIQFNTFFRVFIFASKYSVLQENVS